METMELARRTRKKEASETPSTTWSSPEDLWTKEGTPVEADRQVPSVEEFVSETKKTLNDYESGKKTPRKKRGKNGTREQTKRRRDDV